MQLIEIVTSMVSARAVMSEDATTREAGEFGWRHAGQSRCILWTEIGLYSSNGAHLLLLPASTRRTVVGHYSFLATGLSHNVNIVRINLSEAKSS